MLPRGMGLEVVSGGVVLSPTNVQIGDQSFPLIVLEDEQVGETFEIKITTPRIVLAGDSDRLAVLLAVDGRALPRGEPVNSRTEILLVERGENNISGWGTKGSLEPFTFRPQTLANGLTAGVVEVTFYGISASSHRAPFAQLRAGGETLTFHSRRQIHTARPKVLGAAKLVYGTRSEFLKYRLIEPVAVGAAEG